MVRKFKRVWKPGDKTNIGVLLDVQLWKRFKMHCIEIDERPGELLATLIRQYLDRMDRKSKPARQTRKGDQT